MRINSSEIAMPGSGENEMTGTGLKFLPRSIRWKIQLGLINDCGLRKLESKDGTDKYLEDLALRNEKIIMDHRTKYEKLAEKHFRQSSALSIISDTEINPVGPSSVAKSASIARKGSASKTMVKKSVKNVVDDPLSLMATMEEQKVKVDRKKQIDRKRELLMTSRPHMAHHPSTAKGVNNQIPSKSGVESVVNSNEESFSKTRWDEFYSSKDIIELIEKDLDRMPIDHHVYFYQRKTKENVSVDDDKWNVNNPTMMQSRTERNKYLSEILFVFAKEHSIGMFY